MGAAGREPEADTTSFESSFLGQSVLVTLARILKTALGFAVPVALVRILDQETFGQYRQAILICVSAAAMLQLGLPVSLFYFVSTSPRESQSFHVNTLFLVLVAGVLAGAALTCAVLLHPSLFGEALSTHAIWLGVVVALAAPSDLAETAPIVDGRARLTVGVVACADLLRSALLIAAAVATRSLEAILVTIALVFLLRVGFVAWYLRIRPRAQGRPWSRSLLRRQLAYALPFYAGGLLGSLRDHLPSYFVLLRETAAQYAVYAIGTLWVPFLGHLTASVGEVLVLRNARAFKEGRLGDLVDGWHRAVSGLATLLMPILVLIEIYAEDLIRLVFGEAYVGAAPIYRIFVLTIPLAMLTTSSVLRSIADLRFLVLGDAASLLAAVSFLALWSGSSLMAGVVSLIAGRLTFNVVATCRIAYRLELPVGSVLPWQHLAGTVLAAALSGLLAAVATASLTYQLRPFAGGVLALAAYGALAWHTGLVPASQREYVERRLRQALHKIRDVAPAGAGRGD